MFAIIGDICKAAIVINRQSRELLENFLIDPEGRRIGFALLAFLFDIGNWGFKNLGFDR